jgi:hypothetical protein
MRWKQIAVATEAENGEIFYALNEGGEIYEKRGRYIQAERAEDGSVLAQAYYEYWWEKVTIPFCDPKQLRSPKPIPVAQQEPHIAHLFTDDEVAKMKADGFISDEPPSVCRECFKLSTECICVGDIPF